MAQPDPEEIVFADPTALLAYIGTSLYGSHWRQPFARAAGIDEETIRKWMLGERQLTWNHRVLHFGLSLMRWRRHRLTEDCRMCEGVLKNAWTEGTTEGPLSSEVTLSSEAAPQL